jgi:error-prone DNA polymerase
MVARLLAATGRLQREGRVIHLVADRLLDLTDGPAGLRGEALDPATFDAAMARADEARNDGRDPRRVLPEGRNFR